MHDFRRLTAWQVGHELALEVYQATASFPPDERFGLTSQMRRSAASVPTNIAEGSGRGSEPDFARFLAIAVGSASELLYQVRLARDLGYLDDSKPLGGRLLIEPELRVRDSTGPAPAG